MLQGTLQFCFNIRIIVCCDFVWPIAVRRTGITYLPIISGCGTAGMEAQ